MVVPKIVARLNKPQSNPSGRVYVHESGLDFYREERPEESNTFYAQGGIIYPQGGEEQLVDDINRATSYSCNLEAAKLFIDNDVDIILIFPFGYTVSMQVVPAIYHLNLHR